MAVNSSKTVTDQHVNSKEAAPRPERNSSTRTSRAKASSARTSRAHTGRAQAGPGPDGTGPVGQQPAWRHQRDLPIAGTRPSRSSTASDAVLAYLRLQAHELRSLDQAVRVDEYDAVHQMRVATRR